MSVGVLSKHGERLMPCSERKARLLLRAGKAEKVGYRPFTIQLLYGSSGYKQPMTLGIDSGYETVGFSVVTEAKEVYGGELTLLKGMKERNDDRAMYRRNRRGKLRYRAPRFNNRKKPEDWLAPTVQHKLDSHTQFMGRMHAAFPITRTVVETASFDIHKLKNPDIEGIEYQQGEQSGFWNLREYIFHRDHHQCQLCKLEERKTQRSEVLQVHHLGFWKGDKSDRPSNLIVLCTGCHTTRNHQKGGKLWGWEPAEKSYRPETFMSIVRKRLLGQFESEETFGYLTKSKRIALGIEKSHHNDAFVIADGEKQGRCKPTNWMQVRRHNRSLETFKDARYIDTRDGKPKYGKDLDSGRRKRNKGHKKNGTNLRPFRGQKIRAGKRSIRRHQYPLQPQDVVEWEGKRYPVKGTHNKGKSAYIWVGDQAKSISVSKLTRIVKKDGMCLA